MQQRKQQSQKPSSHWDVIIIGAGVGGLALASFLTKYKSQKVLVLERHTKIGGFSHEFSRRSKYIFDVGVHFVSNLKEGGFLRSYFDLITDNKLQWKKLSDTQEQVFFPDSQFTVHSNVLQLQASLIQKYPSEQLNIVQYFKHLNFYAKGYLYWQYLECLPKIIQQMVLFFLLLKYRNMLQSTERYMTKNFKDPSLIAFLTSHWGAMGLLPKNTPFGLHCLYHQSNLLGTWYPSEGGGSISKYIEKSFAHLPSDVRVNNDVSRILTENNTAIGVEIKHPDGRSTQEYGKTIISNIGIKNTYSKVPSLKKKFQKSVSQQQATASAIMIFIGLHETPLNYGFTQSNYWLFKDYKHQLATFCSKTPDIQTLYLSFPSLKRSDSAPTAEIIIPTSQESFKKWSHTHWQKRPQEYNNKKKLIYSEALKVIEMYFPDFSENIKFIEIGSPLTIKHFQGNPDGALYGHPLKGSAPNFKPNSVQTPIKNLYLVGSDVLFPAVSGAVASSIKTFRVLEKNNIFPQKETLVKKLKLYWSLKQLF